MGVEYPWYTPSHAASQKMHWLYLKVCQVNYRLNTNYLKRLIVFLTQICRRKLKEKSFQKGLNSSSRFKRYLSLNYYLVIHVSVSQTRFLCLSKIFFFKFSFRELIIFRYDQMINFKMEMLSVILHLHSFYNNQKNIDFITKHREKWNLHVFIMAILYTLLIIDYDLISIFCVCL